MSEEMFVGFLYRLSSNSLFSCESYKYTLNTRFCAEENTAGRLGGMVCPSAYPTSASHHLGCSLFVTQEEISLVKVACDHRSASPVSLAMHQGPSHRAGDRHGGLHQSQQHLGW